MHLLRRMDEKINRAERFLVAIFLTTMILVAFSQIVLRNFFSTGIDWGDALVRYLVVWVGFIGAAIATKESKHITIDVLSRWFHGVGSTAIQVMASFFSAVICGLLMLAAIKFIRRGDAAVLADHEALAVVEHHMGEVAPLRVTAGCPGDIAGEDIHLGGLKGGSTVGSGEGDDLNGSRVT